MTGRDKSSVEHPCFSCRLAEFDDRNRRCALRRAMANYQTYIRNRQPIPSEVRLLCNIARNELYAERTSRLSAERHQRKKQAASISNEDSRHG
jgi:phage gp36-like protein